MVSQASHINGKTELKKVREKERKKERKKEERKKKRKKERKERKKERKKEREKQDIYMKSRYLKINVRVLLIRAGVGSSNKKLY